MNKKTTQITNVLITLNKSLGQYPNGFEEPKSSTQEITTTSREGTSPKVGIWYTIRPKMLSKQGEKFCGSRPSIPTTSNINTS